MPALDAGIFLADEKMTGSSPVMMRDVIHASNATNSLSDSIRTAIECDVPRVCDQ